MPGSADSAAVRSAHASITVRARDGVWRAERALVLGAEAHDLAAADGGAGAAEAGRGEVVEAARARPGVAARAAGPNDGDRFSNTATS